MRAAAVLATCVLPSLSGLCESSMEAVTALHQQMLSLHTSGKRTQVNILVLEAGALSIRVEIRRRESGGSRSSRAYRYVSSDGHENPTFGDLVAHQVSLDRDAAATAQQRPPALETILGLPSGELAAQPNQLRICLVTPMSTDGLTLRISLVGSLLLTSTRSPRASMSPSPHRLRRRRWYTPSPLNTTYVRVAHVLQTGMALPPTCAASEATRAGERKVDPADHDLAESVHRDRLEYDIASRISSRKRNRSRSLMRLALMRTEHGDGLRARLGQLC
jgi:hypothetical protein